MQKGTGTGSSTQLDMFKDIPPAAAPVAKPVPGPKAAAVQPLVRPSPVQATVARAVQPSVATPSGSITDAGEELVANRRNRQRRGIRWEDVEGLNDALRVKESVKSNVWLKPDYQQLIDGGMQPLVAHIYKQVYDSIAPKPVTRGAVTESVLKRYIEGVHRVEQGLNAWTQNKEALSAWALRNARTAGAMLGKPVDIKDLINVPSLLESVYPDGWRSQQEELRIVGGNKVLGALQPDYAEIKRAIKAIDTGWPAKREAWEVQGYKIIERPPVEVNPTPNGAKYVVSAGRHFVGMHADKGAADAAAAAIKPVLLLNKRGYIDSFPDHDSAVDHVKGLLRKTKAGASQEIEGGMNVVAAERVGAERRMDGENVSSEQLMEEFGLRGVNFGNWMKTPAARAEAQLHLNHAFDALHDLAEILNIPPKAIGLGGMLGLAIGAQGNGGTAAGHFVPGVNEINITRTMGAGVLSHEYAHALDHYFGQQAGLATSDTPYLSYHSKMPFMQRGSEAQKGEVRPEILKSVRDIVSVMSKRALTPKESEDRAKLALDRTEKDVERWLKSFARDFKDQEAEFSVLADKIRAGDFGGQKQLVGQSTYVSPVVVEMRDLYKAKHGRVYSLDQVKGLQANLDLLAYRNDQAQLPKLLESESSRPVMVSTNYANSAAALDNDKGGKPYWGTTHEMFARAFDSYVADRLDSISAKNSYLSFGVRETPDVPIGEERKTINRAINTLVGELRVKENEVGLPALFSINEQVGPGLSRAAIDTEIERLRGQWKGMPEVIVVANHQELPFDSPADADGAYLDGKVYAISDNIADIQQLQKVMAHECVLHHSLEQMLGNYGFSKLHHGIQSLKSKGDPTITDLASNVRSRYGELPPELETKEIVARAGEQCLDGQGNIKVEYGFMKGVFAGVAGWIRDHGISVPFTNTELQGILHKSGEWAKNGPDLEAAKSKSVAGKLKSLSGLFIGKIVGIQDDVVTQKVGRGQETVLHSMSNLSKKVSLGEIAEIMYRGEKAEVKVQAQGHDMGR